MAAVTPEVIVFGVHVAAGVVALLGGAVAMVTEKGGDRHRRAGRYYVGSMAVVVGTVPLILAFDPTDFVRQFLLLVAVFSGYLVFSGYRVLSRKRPTDGSDPVDRLAAGFVILASLGMGVWGALLAIRGTQIGVVLVVFGAIGGSIGGLDVADFLNPDRRDPWMADHLLRMVGGYIATVTAVSVTNFVTLYPDVVPEVVAWLWPTAVGVPLIWYWQSKYAGVGPLAGVVG
jgi:uncharacterized membrane protein